MVINIVTESGVRLLAAQKPLKRSGWWKGKFALFQTLATEGVGGWRADTCPKANPPPSPPRPPATSRNNQGARAFIDGGRGLHAETAQSALTVILKLIIGGLTSVILIVLGTANLQFHVRFVPISLSPILGIVGAYVIATVWSSCS